jgi:hypothetical protein
MGGRFEETRLDPQRAGAATGRSGPIRGDAPRKIFAKAAFGKAKARKRLAAAFQRFDKIGSALARPPNFCKLLFGGID